VNVLAALSYGDRYALVNALRTLRKHPGRVAMWTFYALAIVGFAFFKTSGLGRSSRPASDWALTIADFWVCGFVVAFGVVLATGTSRTLGVFSSRAEALLLTRACAPPVAVAAYLQVRAVVTTLGQGIARFAYLILFGIPAGTTWHALVAQLCFFAAAGAAIASITLPRALARGTARMAAVAAGIVIALAAALPILADVVRLLNVPSTANLLRHVAVVHPGLVLRALGHGDLRAISIPLAVAALASVAFVLAARDAYPELYAISLANLDWRMRLRTRRDARTRVPAAPAGSRAAPSRSSAGSPLGGALALAWIDTLMFSRRVAPAITALVAAFALAAGAALAAFARLGGELALGVVVGMLPGFYVAVASTTGVRLAPAMRMPLFWLGSVPLAARLAAWTLGPFCRDAIVVLLAVAGYVAVSREARAPLIVLIGALALLALTRTVGLAVFALMPNSLDQRGPAVLLRTLLTFALVAPPAIGGTIAVFVFPAPFVSATLAAALTALAEAALLITFAAWRLAGRVDQLTAA
jgi:hypothetical protein